MKHLLRKLHHHPHRSNDNPQPPPNPSPLTSSSCSGATTSSAGAAEGNSVQSQPQSQIQQDYFSSEEEYQVQLALALSVSSSGQDRALVDSGKAPIRREVQDGKVDADLLSRRYRDFGILDFGERIVDGFYDIQNLSSDPTVQGNMPSLADLESNTGGWNYEVVVVNRKIDPALEELMQIARCILLDCPKTEITVLVQRLAELVTKHLGGPVHDANIILAKFMERRLELKMSPHTAVLPIGSLKVGLSRHRALLFKALADNVGIPCRLVKGSHYTGSDDDAVNIIKLHDDSECLVDLMGAPGTLIPSDIVCSKDAASNYSRQSSSQTSSTNAMSSHNHLESVTSVSGYNSSSGSTSWNPDGLLLKRNPDHDVGTSSQSEKIPLQKLDHRSEQESYIYAGDGWPNFPADSTSSKSNVIPYNPESPVDSKNVFAELNPFQAKDSGNLALQNAHAREVGKQQCLGNNNANASSRAPLIWKSRHASNEVPKENLYVNSEVSLLKKNHGDMNNSASSAFSRNSKVPHEAQEPFRECTSDPTEKNSEFASREKEFIQFPSCLSDVEMCGLVESGGIKQTEFYLQDNLNGRREYKENIQEKHIGSTAKQRKTEDAGCLPDARSRSVDADIDDVGECEILWEDLVLGERIGLGSYGEVYRADLNGTEVAVKKFLDQDFSGAALDEFKREVRIMRRLRHPNVVQFMGAVTRPPNLSIITEFLPRGSLYRIIHRPNCHIDEKRRIKMALDVAKGMNCLHTSRPTIVHRDLKSPNLLVDNDWNVKVCDFGLSRLKHNTFLSSKSTGGTPEWMAPEILRNERSDEKCDVYSFGIILWELVTLKLPWSGMNPMQVVGAVGFQNRRLEIPKEVDPLVARIIWECWQTDPNLRPSFAQLCIALKPLKRLVIQSHVEQQNASISQEITVNSTP